MKSLHFPAPLHQKKRMKLKLTKEELIFALIIVSLCFLVFGMTHKYNVLVKGYNNLVDEVNDCKAKEEPLRYDDLSMFDLVLPENTNGNKS